MLDWIRNYDVVCTKAYYAGQGTEWKPGDIYASTFTLEEAKYYVNLLNSDKWGGNAWTVEQPPK